ncbi:hypothetical protein BT69DRAFT_1283096 [Atractiella rhizophila]|nr:hypothetical protein BT69DRAFT_1283096 [Atractiella rhizophila]
MIDADCSDGGTVDVFEQQQQQSAWKECTEENMDMNVDVAREIIGESVSASYVFLTLSRSRPVLAEKT